ncbi:putative receptor-like protein kinase At3g47110 [Capsicum annuum]|uniref:putative receptor-like protein kinase At3g47110 n=1 Tax=Capsicum annuum TaxID=4072 RepID=UPI001FB095A5|nr:putative receptor-like protein kinase At3g47110 [Capsicum annuum]
MLLSSILTLNTDEAALLALKSYTWSHPNDILASNWSSSNPVCSWIGIAYSFRHHRVTALNISSMQLHGTIPPHLGNLSFLVSLDISVDTGILQALEKASALTIQLFNESTNGVLPEGQLDKTKCCQTIPRNPNKFLGGSNHPKVRELRYKGPRITNNTFHGDFPKELAHLQRLKVINATRKDFTGAVPSFLSLLSNLRSVSLEQPIFGENSFLPFESYKAGSVELGEKFS